jgi:hypothetical protein
MMDVTRGELLEQLERLDSEVRLLRGRRALVTYRLEQSLRERDRIKRHLDAAAREEG